MGDETQAERVKRIIDGLHKAESKSSSVSDEANQKPEKEGDKTSMSQKPLQSVGVKNLKKKKRIKN